MLNFRLGLEEFKRGRPIILVDDETRENEGDIVVATDLLEPDHLAFMMQYARGLICVSISTEKARKLGLPPQVANNNSRFHTPFAISVDHVSLGDRGVTASGRTTTMKRLVAPDSEPSEFVSPGHVFPLIANPAGVIGRQGQTEGGYDLARIGGLTPSAVICEILAADGTMARGASLANFAKEHQLLIMSVADIIRYRVNQEILVRKVAESEMRTQHGLFKTFVFEDDVDGREHLALVYGDLTAVSADKSPLVRVHSECLTGDVFGSLRCDCGNQLDLAMKMIVEEGVGLVLYLRQEGRGIGLMNKLKAYSLQDQGHDTVEANLQLGFPADLRNYAVAAQILSSLGLKQLRLMTNNPEKIKGLAGFDLKITERIPLLTQPSQFSCKYMETKRDKMGHLI